MRFPILNQQFRITYLTHLLDPSISPLEALCKVHFNEFETIIGKINCANLNLWINFSLTFFIRPEKSKRPNGPEREDVVEGIGRVNALSADELRGTLQQGHGGAIN